VLAMIVGLVSCSDGDLLDDGRITTGLAVREEWPAVRQAGVLVQGLMKDFNYAASPEFDRSVAGRSESYRAMKASIMSDPVNRKELKKRFLDALSRALSSDDIYQLLPESKHAEVREVVRLILSLSNPD
jgi:hypothetical protein